MKGTSNPLQTISLLMDFFLSLSFSWLPFSCSFSWISFFRPIKHEVFAYSSEWFAYKSRWLQLPGQKSQLISKQRTYDRLGLELVDFIFGQSHRKYNPPLSNSMIQLDVYFVYRILIYNKSLTFINYSNLVFSWLLENTLDAALQQTLSFWVS